MGRVLALFLCAVLLLGTIPNGIVAQAEGATGYVTDNLVLHLDANNNTGNGFDANATTWTNLANPAEKVKINGQIWGRDRAHASNYLSFEGNYILLPDSVRQALAGEKFTIEFVMDDFVTTANGKICNVMCVTGDDDYIAEFTSGTRTAGSVTNDSFVIFAAKGSDDVKLRTCYGTTGWSSITGEGTYATVTGASMNGVTNALLFDNADGQKWYLDGTLSATKEITVEGKTINLGGFKVGSSWTSERTCQIAFGAATDVIADRYFTGKVKAIRIYSDTLTEQEIAQNAAADQERYYTDYVPNAVIPEGYETDGLVMFLDGNSNTGKSFSTTAEGWVDLADETGATVIDIGSHTWGSDDEFANAHYLQMDSGYIILPEKVRQAIAGGEFTIEFLMDDYGYSAGNSSGKIANIMALTGSDRWIAATTTPVNTPNDNFVVYQNKNESTINFKVNSDAWGTRANVGAGSINDVTQALTFKTNDYTNWYRGGALSSTSKNTYSAPSVSTFSGAQTGEVPQVIFGAAEDAVSGRTFSGKLLAIRVYDRVLDAKELESNAALDKARYRSGSYKQAAQTSWDNVLGNLGQLGKNVTLNSLQTYATAMLADDTMVKVAVSDSGSGKYLFTYQRTDTDAVVNSHTLYVDAEYTLDMSELTADEKAALLNDTVKYSGNANNAITVNWSDDDSALYYKGTRAGDPVTHLYLPVYSSGDSYVYEAEIGFDSYGSWSCMVFGAEEFREHYQYAFYGQMRKGGDAGVAEFVRFQDPEKNSGTFATGHANITTKVLEQYMGDGTNGTIDKSLYDTGNADYHQVKDTIKYKLIVHEGVLYGFVDDVQVLTTPATGTLYKKYIGGFGFNTATSALDIHAVSIRPITNENKEQELADVELAFNPVSSFDLAIYEPDTDIKTAPIVMQTATAESTILADEAKRPSALIFDLKLVGGELCAYDGQTELGSFAEVFDANNKKMNVGVRIALGDLETADALAALLEEENSGNIWVISNDVEVLEHVTDVIPTARGVVDFTGSAVRGPANVSYTFADTDGNGNAYDDRAKLNFDYVTYTEGYAAMTWSEIYDVLFSCNYRTALLPESVINKDYVHYLQGSMVSVLVETDADTELAFYDLITCGVNGILSRNYTANIAALESDWFDVADESILVRGGTVVAHRGDMGNEYLYPENSVESIVTGAQSGAAAVEFDVYMTLDKQLILMHNNNIAGYFTYRDDCPLEESERVADTVGITSRYWEGDLEYLESTYNPDIPMQRLEDLLAVVDTEFPELRLHFDIKDARIECLNRIVAATHEYGVRNRSEMMFFDKSGLIYTNSLGFSGTYLSPVSFYDTDNRIYAAEVIYRPLNSTWHSQWKWINTEFLEELKHYGQTAYPWATYKPGVMDAYYVQGYQGFTTDIPHWTDDYIRSIVPVYNEETGKLTVTAHTLADHEFGTFDESSITVEKWWIDQQVSGDPVYELTDYEVIVLSGADKITVDGDTVTMNDGATGKAVFAVRYKQQLTDASDFYIYSNAITVEADEPAESKVVRIAGASRYETAFASADALKEALGVDRFDNAIVACGDNFADALAGSYLAAVKDAPILLTDNDNIEDVMEYIRENVAAGGTVYALGGAPVVTDALSDIEDDGYIFKRLAGTDRFGTNLKILEEAGIDGGMPVLVCTAYGFADSLSASALGLPILLVDDTVSEEQMDFLRAACDGEFVLVGGTGAVKPAVEQQLVAAGGRVERLAGGDRFATSVLLADAAFGHSIDYAVLAYGYNFPDGLCAGPLAYTLGAPLILTANGDEAAAVEYATAANVKSGFVLGGPSLIDDPVARAIFSMDAGDSIIW